MAFFRKRGISTLIAGYFWAFGGFRADFLPLLGGKNGIKRAKFAQREVFLWVLNAGAHAGGF
ncbi:MAG: hypothetical protein PVI99_10740 [Anaerolineales bacterium]|jgi:hypothetical protein